MRHAFIIGLIYGIVMFIMTEICIYISWLISSLIVSKLVCCLFIALIAYGMYRILKNSTLKLLILTGFCVIFSFVLLTCTLEHAITCWLFEKTYGIGETMWAGDGFSVMLTYFYTFIGSLIGIVIALVYTIKRR